MRVALCVEYEGSGFCGWQSQTGGGSVQDALECALSQVAAQKVQVVCAGRTDAGVHASAQIVHFDSEVDRPLSAWVRGANAHLPDAAAVRWAVEVDERFHARFSATARHYRYLLLNRPVRTALHAGRAGWFHMPLDVSAMQAAAEVLLGEHDFSAFRAAQCQAASPVRTLSRATVQRQGEWIIFDVVGNAFLHHMVRNLVGALVYVGKGELTVHQFAALLGERDRRRAPPTFAAAGLYLCGVEYPPDWSLPDGGRIIVPVVPPPLAALSPSFSLSG